MNSDCWIITLSLCGLIIVTRGLPFLFGQYMTEHMNKLGEELPAYIMLLLVIFEINPRLIAHPPHAWPAFVALTFLLVLHLWRRNTLLSLIAGTGSYLVLAGVGF